MRSSGRARGASTPDWHPHPRRAASEHRGAMFAVVAVALVMSMLDSTIVATALPALQHGLHASVVWAGWTITAYSLGLIMALSVAGKFSDRFGPRRVFLASIGIFTAASLCCGLVGNVYLLVALRFLQAAGGAGFTPSATSIIARHFGSGRDKAIGMFGSFFTVGALIGPLAGGVILTYLSWRWVFLVNVPIGAALIPLSLRFIPRDTADATRRASGLDLPGAALLGVGLLAAMIGLSYLGDTPAGWVVPCVIALAVSALALAGFMFHVERARDPLIAPRLIHGRGFAAVNLINVLMGGAGIGLVALVPLYATNRYDISALGSGTLLAAEGLGAVVLSTLGALALRRTGYRLPIYAGAVVAAGGAVALAIAPIGMTPYVWLASAAALLGIGLGWASPASRNAGLQLVPDQAAPIGALRSTGMQIGSITAVSVATAAISQAADPGIAQAWVYVCYAAVLILIGIPIALRIPEHHGSW